MTKALTRIDALEGDGLLADPRVQKMLDAIINEGAPFKKAATAAGLKHARARRILMDQKVRRYVLNEIDGIRLAERAANVYAAIAIRDSASAPAAKAADRKAALDAIRYLDGESEGVNISVTGNGNVIAGYVVKLDGPSEGPRVMAGSHVLTQHAADGTNLLIDNDAVTID